ncbi:MAG: Glu-tRNA(Gln) amidotransferase subunit GatE [Desulfurococcales archaeon]|nr:Glu-tRNA(Gln) amidotransferase subunit GatE [Desulfurococcales archaeon]
MNLTSTRGGSTVSDELDYSALGLKVGLEIHQQLDTKHKLFCGCPTSLASDDVPRKTVERYLRVAKSEVGEIDPAALYEMRKGRKIIYEVPEGHACMVELDEEPPHELNRDALTITLAVAEALHSKPVDEVYVMRKIVIDGSNTTGFQRTAVVAFGGWVEDEEGKVGIQTICLEEDAARKVEEGKGYIKYNLDRLGIPLIEISTAPDIRSPEQAARVALKIGLLMRLTGRVKRGLGTIRQDLNVSIKGGVKTEVKGVSKLDLIPKVVKYEAMRQLNLLKIKEELLARGVKERDVYDQPIEITEILSGSGSKLVSKALKRGEKAYAILLKGFKGVLGKEVQPGRRFGTELSDYAKAWGGVKGIIHSDELPGYGIGEDVVARIYEVLGGDPGRDAFVFVLGNPDKAFRALKAVGGRAKHALQGIPKETRGANPDGTTRYLRPQPGAARMYPETDVPPVRITEDMLREAAAIKPPTPEEMLAILTERHGLSRELAEGLLRDPALQTYLDLVEEVEGVPPQLVASTLLVHLKGLKSEGVDPSAITYEVLKEVLRAVAQGKIAKEAIPEILLKYGKLGGKTPIKEIIDEFGGVKVEDLDSLIEGVLSENEEVVKAKGERAFSLVMGKVMGKVRGRVDGKLVAERVREKLKDFLRRSS